MIGDETPHPYARTSLMYIFMGHVRYQDTKLKEDDFWHKNRIQLVHGKVDQVDIKTRNVVISHGPSIHYDYLIIASGSVSRTLDIPGQNLGGVHHLYHLQDLESIENTLRRGVQRAVVAGGGLIGIELVEMLASRHIPVHFLIRESGFWANVLPGEERDIVHNHIRAHGIQLHLQTEIKKMLGEDQVKNLVLSNDVSLPADLVAIVIGVKPNIQFLKESGIQINQGILVDHSLQTNIPNVYAIGDCAEIKSPQTGRKSIEPVWYTAKIMGEVVAENISGQLQEYQPGLWYNSAKFFDIEYQCYGQTHPESHGNGFDSIFWQHEYLDKSLRIFYHPSGQVTGFSALGLRLRQHVCEQWIYRRSNIQEVVKNIKQAFFDPEFYKTFEKEILRVWETKYRHQNQHT